VMLGGIVLKAFLVDGVVAGVWQVERGVLTLSPFGPLPRVPKRELEDEARAVAAFHGAAKVRFG
jgi:winged helix DNA-binding protein